MSKVYKPSPISGFPEWLPEERRAELAWFDHIRATFERYGFCSIETPSVEELDAINAKGGDGESDVDKEVYVIERLHKDENDTKEARLALHFDQTVPFARYTAQHFNELVFPFKRYQMQKVWRGERPQAGRFREFYQCDIDVINIDKLPLHFDAEMPAVIYEILSSLPGMENEKFFIRISNRKILMGLVESFGIDDPTEVTHIVDKFEKVEESVTRENLAKAGLTDAQVNDVITLIKERDLTKLNAKNEQMKEGIEELSFVMDQLKHLPQGAVIADLSIVRGLDYYTGTVYETMFNDDPGYGSICSGGRYDDLAGKYINKHLPGVGISIGFTRLFERIRSQGKLPKTSISPADVMVVLPDEESRAEMMEIAQTLRTRGYNVETFHSATKLKKQLAYASKKGIPYVWILPDNEVKNMQTGEQTPASPTDWIKDED